MSKRRNIRHREGCWIYEKKEIYVLVKATCLYRECYTQRNAGDSYHVKCTYAWET
jgi:hypothetical protein